MRSGGREQNETSSSASFPPFYNPQFSVCIYALDFTLFKWFSGCPPLSAFKLHFDHFSAFGHKSIRAVDYHDNELTSLENAFTYT